MNVLGLMFLNSSKDRWRDVKTESFIVRCRRTYVLKNQRRYRILRQVYSKLTKIARIQFIESHLRGGKATEREKEGFAQC